MKILEYAQVGDSGLKLRVLIVQSDTGANPGQALTGLGPSSAGLIIGTIAGPEATSTAYTQAAGNIEAISLLGTFAAPTSGKIRFGEVDPVNHEGVYEIHIADGRLNITTPTTSRSLIVSIQGPEALDILADSFVVYQNVMDEADVTSGGETAIENKTLPTLAQLNARTDPVALADINNALVRDKLTLLVVSDDKTFTLSGGSTNDGEYADRYVMIVTNAGVIRGGDFCREYTGSTGSMVLDNDLDATPVGGGSDDVALITMLRRPPSAKGIRRALVDNTAFTATTSIVESDDAYLAGLPSGRLVGRAGQFLEGSTAEGQPFFVTGHTLTGGRARLTLACPVENNGAVDLTAVLETAPSDNDVFVLVG